jgi:hypothetical protein
VADERAGPGGGGLEGGNAGDDFERDAGFRAVEAAAVEKLAGQRSHGIDPGIAGRDEGDATALAGQRQGLAHAGLLGAKVEPVLDLAGRQMGHQVEIEAVADPVGCLLKGGGGGGAQPLPAARPDADDEELAAGAAGQVEERQRALRHRAGGAA